MHWLRLISQPDVPIRVFKQERLRQKVHLVAVHEEELGEASPRSGSHA